MIYKHFIELPIGKVWIYEEDEQIVQIGMHESDTSGAIQNTVLIQQAKEQLLEYFAGKRKVFQLPLNPHGTAFQKKVWNALQNIPYGETRTYGEIASEIGNHKASRAVGGANNKNPIMIVIPCHRVIGAKGNLVGYALGLDVKEKLLGIENMYYDK